MHVCIWSLAIWLAEYQLPIMLRILSGLQFKVENRQKKILLPFSIRVAELPPVRERAVHSVKCTCLTGALVKFCMCPSFHFGIEGVM